MKFFISSILLLFLGFICKDQIMVTAYLLRTTEGAQRIFTDYTNSIEEMKQEVDDVDILYVEIEDLIDEMTRDGSTILEDIENFLGNPVNQHSLMTRYTSKWKKLQTALQSVGIKKSFLPLSRPMMDFEPHIEETKLFLTNLGTVYDLNVKNLSRGIIENVSAFTNLTADECASMAEIAWKYGLYDKCVDWLQETLIRTKFGEQTTYEANYILKSMTTCQNGMEIYSTKTVDKYIKLCREESMISTANDKRVGCYFWNSSNIWFKFNPIKIEYLSFEPDIVLYRNFLSAEEVDSMTSVALEDIANSSVTNVDGTRYIFSTIMNEKDKENWIRIQQRISEMTGICVKQIDSIDVIHFPRKYFTDFSKPEQTNNLNFMIFMSNVEKGGSVVFQDPQLSVKPRKGDALFWKGNSGILKMAHCPVALGDQWIAKLQIKNLISEYHFDLLTRFGKETGNKAYYDWDMYDEYDDDDDDEDDDLWYDIDDFSDWI